MTPDTQILQELVEAVNRPDWWTIGITSAITIINAAIMVWLGWNQYKLQKRQTEAQEYNVYRKLYPLVYSANYRITYFMENMWGAMWKPTYEYEGKDYLANLIREIDDLINELSHNRIDFELKFTKEFFDLNGYIELLSRMSLISHYIEESITKGEVVMTEGVLQGSGDLKMDIAKHFTKREARILLIQRIDKFLEAKSSVTCTDEILTEIKKRCKID